MNNVDSFLCEAGAVHEETFDDINIRSERDCFPCEIRTEAKETTDDSSITIGHDHFKSVIKILKNKRAHVP